MICAKDTISLHAKAAARSGCTRRNLHFYAQISLKLTKRRALPMQSGTKRNLRISQRAKRRNLRISHKPRINSSKATQAESRRILKKRVDLKRQKATHNTRTAKF
ncbi:MAG: hypothetical protein SOW25_05465 [Helicobacter sp.]|nr:hypothetical protein [Helicobacter sp.]